jgi:hypothetical protein
VVQSLELKNPTTIGRTHEIIITRRAKKHNMSKLNFKITSYKNQGHGHLFIEGQKLPPPSKRITLLQKNIKVLSAQIIHKHKKGDIEFEVIRINRVKSFGEVRLHTASMLYPGNYEIKIEYTGELEEENLKAQAVP